MCPKCALIAESGEAVCKLVHFYQLVQRLVFDFVDRPQRNADFFRNLIPRQLLKLGKVDYLGLPFFQQ